MADKTSRSPSLADDFGSLLERAEAARERIKDVVLKTPLKLSSHSSRKMGSDVFLKYENLQVTGSFKIRGAYHKISGLSDAEKARGIIAASAGNHAQGVALAAQKAGAKTTIVMPETAPLIKIQATESYGAKVILHGEIYDEAFEYAQKLSDEEGQLFVHPFQDEDVILGQGTIALEILEDRPVLDSIVVPIGGGGLIAGIGMVIKALRPSCKVYGVQSERAPSMYKMFKAQEAEAIRATVADGIAVKTASPEMYDKYISKCVDDIITVSDEDIAQTIVYLLEKEKTVVEGAGATALTGVFSGKLDLGKKTCALLCGGNIDLNTIAKVIDKGLTRSGRLAQISVVVDDSPGGLHRITELLGEQKANILDVKHSRADKMLGLREARIEFLLETVSEEHINRICEALKEYKAKVIR